MQKLEIWSHKSGLFRRFGSCDYNNCNITIPFCSLQTLTQLSLITLLQGANYFHFTFVHPGSLFSPLDSQHHEGRSNVYLVVQLPSHVQVFVTPWTASCQASLSFTIFWSLPKFMSVASVMPSSHLIFWCPCLLLPSIFPSIRNVLSYLPTYPPHPPQIPSG